MQRFFIAENTDILCEECMARESEIRRKHVDFKQNRPAHALHCLVRESFFRRLDRELRS